MIQWVFFLLDLIPSLAWGAGPILALADVVEANPLAFWMPLLNIGGVGAVLTFVLWKLEPRMRGAEAAVDRQTRMLAIFLIEMPHIMKAATVASRSMLTELDEAKQKRSDPNEK